MLRYGEVVFYRDDMEYPNFVAPRKVKVTHEFHVDYACFSRDPDALIALAKENGYTDWSFERKNYNGK